MTTRRNDPDWFAFLRVGDVLATRAGTLRVVRKLSRDKRGQLSFVDFVIRRCSWTKRPITCLSYCDLKSAGYRYVGARVKLDTAFDREIEHETLGTNDRRLKCCDVRGVA